MAAKYDEMMAEIEEAARSLSITHKYNCFRLAIEATKMAAKYDEMLAEIEEAALDLADLQGKPVDPRDTIAVSSIV